MRHYVLIYRGAGDPEELALELDGPNLAVSRGGVARRAGLETLPDGRVSLLFDDGRQICGRVSDEGGGAIEIVTGGVLRRLALAEPLIDRISHSAEGVSAEACEEEVRALMPGRVVEIAAAEGDRLAPGALLLVLEAMKMQNEIRTAGGGIVARMVVEAGRAVDGGALLAVMRPDD